MESHHPAGRTRNLRYATKGVSGARGELAPETGQHTDAAHSFGLDATAFSSILSKPRRSHFKE